MSWRTTWYWWERDPDGPAKLEITSGWRVYVMGRRVHHGRAAVYLVGIAAVLMYHDRRDFPWPASP